MIMLSGLIPKRAAISILKAVTLKVPTSPSSVTFTTAIAEEEGMKSAVAKENFILSNSKKNNKLEAYQENTLQNPHQNLQQNQKKFEQKLQRNLNPAK